MKLSGSRVSSVDAQVIKCGVSRNRPAWERRGGRKVSTFSEKQVALIVKLTGTSGGLRPTRPRGALSQHR